MFRALSPRAILHTLLLPVLMAPPLSANERHFSYTYETAVLPVGAKEIEVWNTVRTGREYFYNRIDQRVEFETGITDRLMGALYLNYRGVTSDAPNAAGTLVRTTSAKVQGLSLEFKYKLSDPVAHALGTGLYAEFSQGPDETEFEAKFLMDKKLGNWLFAANLVGELELKYALKDENGKMVSAVETEQIGETDAGASYLVNERFSCGLEFRTHTERVEGEIEHTVFFLGPTLSFATPSWWTVLTVLPQIGAMGHHVHGNLDLEEHEKVNARLLVAFHL